MFYNSNPSLIQYIDEASSSRTKPTNKKSNFKSYSWILYFVGVLLAFYILPTVLNALFEYTSFLINILFFIVFSKIIFTIRKQQLQDKDIYTYRDQFVQIKELFKENGFYKTAQDLTDILNYAPIVYQSNKELIYIINNPLKEYIQTLINISQMIDNKKQRSKIHSVNALKKIFSFIEKNMSKINGSNGNDSNNFKGIKIENLFRIGSGKHFEGIEILNGFILIGRNEYFDGLIISEIKFGKVLKNNLQNKNYKAQLNSKSTNETAIENTYDKLLNLNNNSLKETALFASSEIASIRLHFHEFITNDIKNNLNRTSALLKEKIATEKRIHEELNRF
ncbi:hypothetical protein [Fluviispira sanaruensis]|uniref:hypothetical protein n=1 Tax=Fluviispira sanaruensis TaxID=2493639 RepID=UPI00102ECA54|nr:hypothetical protein [Fluviispira sanaruensis]